MTREAVEMLHAEALDEVAGAVEDAKNRRAAEAYYQEALYSPGRYALEQAVLSEVKDDHHDLEARLLAYAADLQRWQRLGVYDGPTELVREAVAP